MPVSLSGLSSAAGPRLPEHGFAGMSVDMAASFPGNAGRGIRETPDLLSTVSAGEILLLGEGG